MKKSIIALSAFLLLFVLLVAPSQADIMSAEDRAILRTQLESTPIGEEDPWGEQHSSVFPENNNSNDVSLLEITSESDSTTSNDKDYSGTIVEILIWVANALF